MLKQVGNVSKKLTWTYPFDAFILVYSNKRFSASVDSPPSHGVSSGLQSKPDKKPEMAYPTVLKHTWKMKMNS